MKQLLYILLLISSLPMMLVRAQECDTIRIVASVYDEERMAIINANIGIDGTTVGTVTDQDSLYFVNISFRLPIYIASGPKLARLRWAINHMDYRNKLYRWGYVQCLPRVIDNIDGSNKNTNYYDLGTRDDRILIRTHRAQYPSSLEQMYGDSCVGCISVGNDWIYILDESTAECFKRTNEMQTFSYSVIDGGAPCFYLEKSREIQFDR